MISLRGNKNTGFQASGGANHRVKKANEIYQDSQSFLTAEI
jgi:hypothetical protein